MERDDDRADVLLILLALGISFLVAGLVAWVIFKLGKVSARHLAQRRRDHHLEKAKRRALVGG